MGKNTQLKLTRRQFVKKTAAVGLALGVPPLIGSSKTCYAAQSVKTSLAVVTGDRIPATRKALQVLGGMEAFVKKGDRVVLKPNMSFPHPPQRATNTHPEVVATVAQMCMEAGAREILVLDFPFNRPKPCLRLSGIKDACQAIKNVYAFTIVEEKFFQTVPVKQGKAIRQVKIMKDVLNSDVLINLPTAKSHTTTGVSLGMKGLMGIIWDRKYFHSSVDINQAIADLSSAVKVDLIVLDASRALVNGGPSGPGKIEQPRTIIAGTDPVAVDAMGVTLVKWYGQKFDGSRVKHIAAAHQMGLGTININELKVLEAHL
jgi:uncharacterized protein (DUF362 family)